MRRLQTARGTPLTEPARRRSPARARWIFAAVAATGLVADVVTKIIAVRSLDPQQPVELLGGLLTLRLIRNPGAAFSLGEQATFVFALLAAAVIIFVLTRVVPKITYGPWAVALGLLVAGVGGNLADRLFRSPGVLRGHVVDFLQLPHWPIFNVADMCITAAAVLIMILAVVKNVDLRGVRQGRGSTPTQTKDPA